MPIIIGKSGRAYLGVSRTAYGKLPAAVAITYATTFTVSAPTTMTVGTAYPVTITPNGTWPVNSVVMLGLSAIAGTFVNGVGNGTTPVVIQFTPSAASNGFINASVAGMTSSGAASVQATVASAGSPGHRYWRINISAPIAGFIGMAEVAMATSAGGSNALTGGTVFASSSYVGYDATRALDGNPSTEWIAADNQPASWGYDFGIGNAPAIAEVRITPRNASQDAANSAPAAYTFEWSDDGTTWVVRSSYNISSWGIGIPQTFAVPPFAAAPTYFVSPAKSGGQSGQTVQVSAIPSGAAWADSLTLTPVLTGALVGAAVSPATISPIAASFSPAVFTVTLPTTGSQASGTVNVSTTRSVSTPLSYSPSGVAPTSIGAQKFTVNPTGASAVKVDDFTLANWGSGSSLGFARIGVLFAKGLVPAGSSLDLRRSGTSLAYQADDRSTWSDGSLKRATVHLRDTALAAAAVNSYEWWTAPGVAWNNTGSKTLADLTSYDLRAEIANLQQTDNTTTYTTVGSGAFLSQFNIHATVATRVEKYHSGPVVDGWVVWGMTHDTTGGAEDAHLKTNWYVDVWKNADGSIAAVEAAPVMAQDWWSIANKRVRRYGLTLKANGIAVTTYTSVDHNYHCHWIACINDQSGNRGRRPWIGAPIPTLLYTPNKVNWTKAGLPSLKNTARPDYSNTQNLVYVPCSSADQRGFIDGTGAYDGRGVMPNVHTQCFVRPSAQNAAAARINGIAGMGFFGQFRSNRQRKRPQDAASDIANTIISTRLYATGGVTLPSDDFRAVGMPVAVDAYSDYRSDPGLLDGYVPVNGGGVGGPGGYWAYNTSDGSHAANYSGWSWLYEGERYIYEATLSGAMNLVNEGLGNSYGCFPSLQQNTTPHANGAPNVQYSSITYLAAQERSTGWGINNSAWAAAFPPDDHPTAPFIRRFSQQQTLFLGAILQYLPASEKAAGISPFGLTGDAGISSPWMANFSVITGQFAARMTEDAGYKAWADMIVNQTKHMVARAPILTASYRSMVRTKAQPWVAGVNEARTPALMSSGAFIADAAGSTIRQFNDYNGAILKPWISADVGTEVYTMTHDDNGASTPVPGGIVDGQVYYITSITNKGSANPSVVLNTQANGSGTTPTFTAGDAFHTTVLSAVMITQTTYDGTINTVHADGYEPIAYAALLEDLRANPGTADASLVTKQGTYVGTPQEYAGWANWDYDVVPA